MFGMIHRGIRQMIVDTQGELWWRAVEQDTGIGPAELISANVYDDAVTLALLSRVAEKLGVGMVGMADLLGRFGRYWIQFAERGSYGAIMDFTGHDLPSFIGNLDRMHQAVTTAMPQARVPSFALEHQEEGLLMVRYVSEREGLEPFVQGLLEGLLDRFGLTGSVEPASRQSDALRFAVRYRTA